MNTAGTDYYLKLYEDYFLALCYFATRFGLPAGEAEDIVQDVFYRLYTARNKERSAPIARSYLYTAVRNGCLNWLRNEESRRKTETKYLEELPGEKFFYDQVIENEVSRQLFAVLKELPPQCRIVFEHSLEGMTSEEIAKLMDISVETVKTHRKKAKKLLREKYALLHRIFSVLLV